MIKLEWDQERWVKVYVRDSGDFAMLSWDAKALLLMLWRKADPLGVVRSAARCLPAFLGHRENAAQIEQGLADLEAIGAVEVRTDSLRLLEFVDAQSAVLCDRVRQAARRERKAVRGTTIESQNVTESHEMSRDVTHGHAASRDVTTRQDQTRQEEIRSEKTPIVEPPALQPDPKPQANASASAGLVLTSPESQPNGPQDAKAPKPTRKPDPIPNIALGLFAELQQARRRCNPNVPNSESKAKGATREIERCLRDGLSVDQLRHVIAVWEAMVKAGKRLFEHFNSVTPFRASNVYQYVEMPLDTAKAGRTDPRKSDDPIPNIALGLFAELQQARRRCNPNVPNTESKAKGATREIERCLREGLSVDQLRHVIAIWEALVKAGKRNFEHFNSVTPFRASNVHAYIQMPLETAKSSPTDPRKSPADLAREADNKAYFAELRGKLGAIDVPSVPSQPQIEGDYE